MPLWWPLPSGEVGTAGLTSGAVIVVRSTQGAQVLRPVVVAVADVVDVRGHCGAAPRSVEVSGSDWQSFGVALDPRAPVAVAFEHEGPDLGAPVGWQGCGSACCHDW